MVLYGGYLEPSCKSLHHQACHGMYTYLVMYLGFTAVLCLGCPVMPHLLSSVSVLSNLPYPAYYNCSVISCMSCLAYPVMRIPCLSHTYPVLPCPFCSVLYFFDCNAFSFLSNLSCTSILWFMSALICLYQPSLKYCT